MISRTLLMFAEFMARPVPHNPKASRIRLLGISAPQLFVKGLFPKPTRRLFRVEPVSIASYVNIEFRRPPNRLNVLADGNDAHMAPFFAARA
jgi:hypothetical protein